MGARSSCWSFLVPRGKLDRDHLMAVLGVARDHADLRPTHFDRGGQAMSSDPVSVFTAEGDNVAAPGAVEAMAILAGAGGGVGLLTQSWEELWLEVTLHVADPSLLSNDGLRQFDEVSFSAHPDLLAIDTRAWQFFDQAPRWIGPACGAAFALAANVGRSYSTALAEFDDRWEIDIAAGRLPDIDSPAVGAVAAPTESDIGLQLRSTTTADGLPASDVTREGAWTVSRRYSLHVGY